MSRRCSHPKNQAPAPTIEYSTVCSEISRPFGERVDALVPSMWKESRSGDFLPHHVDRCAGAGHMHDTATRFGAIGRRYDSVAGHLSTDWFPPSGTGQINLLFPITETSPL